MSVDIELHTPQEQLVRSLQSATDYAKKLRDIFAPSLNALTNAERETVNKRLLEMRMSISKSIEAYNEFAIATGAVAFNERFYLEQIE